MLILNFIISYLLSAVSARIFGNECECVRRRSIYMVHNHSRTRGTRVSQMLDDVATRDTSRAVMDVIRVANGHSPVSSCSQQEVVQMELDYQTCSKKMQYQLKCFDLTKEQQCLLLNSFLEECTNQILGRCFEPHFTDYISSVQKWSLSSHHIFQQRLQDICLADQEEEMSEPNVEDITTTKPRIFDRANILRRYLRHPAISKYSK